MEVKPGQMPLTAESHKNKQFTHLLNDTPKQEPAECLLSLQSLPPLSLASVQHHTSCSCGSLQLCHTVSEKTKLILRYFRETKLNSALNSRDQENAEVSRTEGLLERLEQEIAELRRRDAELEQLSHTEDHIHFLQSCQSLCAPPGPGDLPSITVSPHISFKAMRKSVSASERKEEMEEVQKGLKLLTMDEPAVKEVHTVELRTREDFLQYYCQLTLDRNTANNCLSLPEGNREANRKRKPHFRPDDVKRFNKAAVLCKQPLSGCHYWEVDWSGKGRVNMAVAYEDIDRKEGALGHDDKSWRLLCSDTNCGFWHNNKKTELTVSPSSRIGVYLDHKAGILSFYSVAGTMTRLHRIETKFTQPLYPGFWLDENCSVKLVDLESEPEKKALQPDKKEK
ncbi:hypothetical protein COCON_G00070640 [Conger conger]|uniref:B30.2/SPRY domain-containing protein n=1 Tax=Conger conger TaxID=82655 RepID=A0A9Q1DT79_CONCO|nr:hypothetical protein COCON_G00070640 [Conger conger]